MDADDTYDWFRGYAHFRDALAPWMARQDAILVLGCGNSGLCADLWADGFTAGALVNVDYSEAVIARMRARMPPERFPGVAWHVLDFRALHVALPAAHFDVVLDKGSLDALWSDGGSPWAPSPAVVADVTATLDGVLHVLRPGGRFICISFGQPHFRLPLLERPGAWMLAGGKAQQLGLYFIYVFIRSA